MPRNDHEIFIDRNLSSWRREVKSSKVNIGGVIKFLSVKSEGKRARSKNARREMESWRGREDPLGIISRWNRGFLAIKPASSRVKPFVS